MADPSTSESFKRRTRGVTTTSQLKNRLLPGQKLSIEFDPDTGRPDGDNAARFCTYLSYLARSKTSILIPKWRDVPEKTKDMIWEDVVVLTFISCCIYICI